MTSRHVLAVRQRRIQDKARDERIISVLQRVGSGFVYPLLLAFLTCPYGDYDWGWHYRYGEYLLAHGRILRNDPFSWTMSGFEWVNHSWLYDPLLYSLFTHFSFWGLSLAAAAIGVLAFHIGIKRSSLSWWQVGILGICFVALTREAFLQGFRTQVIAVLLFTLLLALLLQARQGKAWCYWALPGLFLIWANSHGSFVLGLAIFAIFAGCDLVLPPAGAAPQSRRFVLAGVLLVSVGVTLINPFTYRVYLEAARHFGDPLLPVLLEWRPPDLSWVFGTIFVGYSVLLAWGIFTRRKSPDIALIAVAVLTFALTMTAKRHGPIFLVTTLPFAASIVRELPLRTDTRMKTAVVSAIILVVCSVGLSLKLPEFSRVAGDSPSTYCSSIRCPEELAEYLLRHPPRGRGLNFYDWGGYFIGRGIETKWFIDGRMHGWARDGYRPMADYVAMVFRDDFEMFDRYQFDWVVMPRRSVLVARLEAAQFSSRQPPGSTNWELVYSDNVAAYLVRRH